ncbi:nuclear-pore anchor [Dorcoceras hygrometricum]|uniref:Nuclear-pore anchor n=1 Tax=Dorcoceras hygrometricum TaxID=472368 RepID=A0A2Z7BM44_9LAMI|nr:nuclear-pore anchor [Dorcoceras hygrometricum]
MHFDDNDTADTSICLPPAAIDVMESLDKLRASVDQVQCEQFGRRDDAHNLKDILLVHIRDLEKKISTWFDEQDIVHRALRKDMHDQKNLSSLDLKSTHQKLSAQIAAAAFDTVDVRKEVKEINAKVTYLDGQVSEIRSEQLDFRANTEENYLNLSTQLGLIVDFLRSGDAKKGESGSSRPQPPPDDQSRPSGGSGDSGTRQSGSRGGSQRRGDRSGSSKRRSYSSGGGPFRRSFEDWLG